MENQQRLHRTVEEVRMVEPEVVRKIEALKRAGFGAKRISRELGVARNTVRRYLRGGALAPGERARARRLSVPQRQRAVELFDGVAEANAVVVTEMLVGEGASTSVRTVQRALVGHRRAKTAQAIATVRFETAPGKQMQVDFGQKRVWIGGESVVVYLLVATLAYSRRLFVQAFLSERREAWLEGIGNAFRHFGGVPETLLADNARALVLSRERSTQTITFDPGYLAFCKEWDVVPRACAPYRARTKGKVESAVKYVKRNALAGRRFDSFAALESHLAAWIEQADRRRHGTTGERPVDRFAREQEALRPLPERRFEVARRLRRRVAADARIDLDLVRYSVPFGLVRESVEVLVTTDQIVVFHGSQEIARHRRCREPYTEVIDPSHFEGLWRRRDPAIPQGGETEAGALAGLGRRLADYAAIVEASR
jgi:transposase